MTNFEMLQNMNIEEFAKWLDEHSKFVSTPWAEWFNENYCDKCESIEREVDEKYALFPGHTTDCAYCELENKCRFFPDLHEGKNIPDTIDILRMWLQLEH